MRASQLAIRSARDSDEVRAALSLRMEVFCAEQGVPADEELDACDEHALHLVAVEDGAVLGTCRLVLDGDGAARLGRMAVRRDARRRGIGGALLRRALTEASGRGLARVGLHSQRPAQSLYARAGFKVIGKPFAEAGIEHVAMELSLELGSGGGDPPASSRSPAD